MRPREMATGTQNEVGEHVLDSLGQLVYVPPQCAGKQRCPLIVAMHTAFRDANAAMEWERPVANKYGMIVFAPHSPTSWRDPDAPDSLLQLASERDLRNLDGTLKEILRRFAIEPDKIALVGRSNSGAPALIWGGYNPDVFSRIVTGVGRPPTNTVDPRNKTTQFLMTCGILESEDAFRAVQELRRDGHPVQLLIALKPHADSPEEHDYVMRWLRDSWATPNSMARPAPKVVADPLPLLTTEVLTQMRTFWTRFLREPDSILETARRAHQKEFLLPIGEERPSTVMVDMPELAAQYASVAAALKAAGLSAQQHDAYRIALLSALATRESKQRVGTLGAIAEKNFEFLLAHPDEFDALGETAAVFGVGPFGMWVTP